MMISKNQRMSSRLNQVHFKDQEESWIQVPRIKIKIQESREDSIKISIKKFFQKLSSTWISKPLTKEFLLSGNRLPVAQWFSKSFQNEFTTFQLISKCCNRLQVFGNRLPVCLNVEIQI